MNNIESVLNVNDFSEWLELKTNISKKCLEKQVSDWKYDYNKLRSLSNRFRRFQKEIATDPEFYAECKGIFEEIAECEKQFNKLTNTTSDLEKESYNEILFFRPILQPLNFVPFVLTIWSFIRIYLLPGLSLLIPFLTLIAPYFLIKYAFSLPINLENYMKILQSLMSGNFNELTNPSSIPATPSNVNPMAFLKRFGIILITFVQGIIQPYWSYKHLYSIDNIIVSHGTLVIKFKTLYMKLYDTLHKHGFTFFKCPLPQIRCERDAAARIILESSYFKLALKYIGSLEVIMALASKKDVTAVEWVQYNKYNRNYYKIYDTYDFNVSSDKCEKLSFNSMTHNHNLLTGPNKGGKSTALRALSISALLAHTYGCVIGRHCEITPFYNQYVCLKPDDLPGSKSRFEREIEFTANTLKSDKPCLVFIDELYHSTNPPDALRSCQIYCKQLWEKENIISVISTHLFELVENAPPSINRLCCPADINDKGEIKFYYSLKHGICKVSSVDELLQRNGLNPLACVSASAIKESLKNPKAVQNDSSK